MDSSDQNALAQPLPREEYVEQAHLFRTLRERFKLNLSTQESLAALRDELLATSRLPMAVDFLVSELRLHGVFGPAMRKLSHYFTPYQAFVMASAEDERQRFDFFTALEVLEKEAEYRSESPTVQGVFLFQFEAVSRNRLGFDHSLEAIAGDPVFDDAWREWILSVRRQIGLIDIADLIYVRSKYYVQQRQQQVDRGEREADDKPGPPVLFGEREGRIALANRQKDPMYLFAALERQLKYPHVPRPEAQDAQELNIPKLLMRLDQMEQRLRFLEEEAKGGIDLSKLYTPPS